MTGLVSGAVTGVTIPWVNQVVDVVAAAVLYMSVDWGVATVSIHVDADFSLDCTLSHCRMTSTQPGGEVCTTSHHWWTYGHHFCACIAFEAIPAIECGVVTIVGACWCVVIFSCSICQRCGIFTCLVLKKNTSHLSELCNSYIRQLKR